MRQRTGAAKGGGLCVTLQTRHVSRNQKQVSRGHQHRQYCAIFMEVQYFQSKDPDHMIDFLAVKYLILSRHIHSFTHLFIFSTSPELLLCVGWVLGVRLWMKLYAGGRKSVSPVAQGSELSWCYGQAGGRQQLRHVTIHDILGIHLTKGNIIQKHYIL